VGGERVTEAPEELDEFLADGYISAVLGKIKEGKEAEVYLCEAGQRTGETYLAAKVHRAVAHRRFRDDGIYREGRVIQSRTVAKAIEKRSRFGQEMMGATWLMDEYHALRDMESAGVPVPRVWAHTDHALLLTFLGSEDGEAAPPLYTLRPSKDEAWALWRELERAVATALGANLVHADLSPYNVLVVGTRPYIIDWPQAVDPRHNHNARWLLERDVTNLCQYFHRYGVGVSATAVAGQLWRRWQHGDL
jgi:RIO kinase 1